MNELKLSCPVPRPADDFVLLAHGGGGKLTNQLIERIFLPAFGTRCTPETPLGAPMVSSEGACAAYYLYGRHKHERSESELPRTASRG